MFEKPEFFFGHKSYAGFIKAMFRAHGIKYRTVKDVPFKNCFMIVYEDYKTKKFHEQYDFIYKQMKKFIRTNGHLKGNKKW